MTMHINKYATQDILAGMTRIEMLIALYDRTIQHCESIERDNNEGNSSGAAFHVYKAQKLINGIHSGISQDGSELANNLNRLLEYCQHQVTIGQPLPAIRTLQILRDAWLELRDEANRLEAHGLLPGLASTGSSMEVMV